MSQETPAPAGPVAPATPAEPKASSCLVGVLGCGGVAVVLVFVAIALLVWKAEDATDYPRVAPEDMAGRAFQRSQEAYDLMGFQRTVRPGVERIGVSTENTFSSGYCYDGGLLGLDDKTVDGAYTMSHRWAVNHVPAGQAVPGLRKLRRHLEEDGWEVSSYREGGKGKGDSWDLFVQRDGGDQRMSFTWYQDREYFTGGASVPCAYDPEWKSGDVGPPGDDLAPSALGPSRAS
ncbi:hypothetical protein ACQB60_09205 [Actinomycetota bacterium Odt1-20B]